MSENTCKLNSARCNLLNLARFGISCQFSDFKATAYDGFKSYVNVTEGIGKIAEERIRVVKEEAETSAFNQAYDKYQAKQYKVQTRKLLKLARQKVHGQINQRQLIMIISTAIQNIPAKVCTDSFATINHHPHHHMTIHDWIQNISPSAKTGKKSYSLNLEGSYYYAMLSAWKMISVPI